MEKWFYTGQKMPDGTLISVAARNSVQESVFREKGFKPVREAEKARGKKPPKGKKRPKAE